MRGKGSMGISALLALTLCLAGFTWPWQAKRGWPSSSEEAVITLDHPVLEQHIEEAGRDVAQGFSFAVFGDQRALADGEWQEMLDHLARYKASDRRMLFVLDTGDIVQNGKHSDQFHRLQSILKPVRDLPYLVGIGNHEVNSNQDPAARRHTEAFLRYLDPDFGVERMYYQKRIGPARFLFLDSNDLVYGDHGENPNLTRPLPGSRGETQMRWLTEALAQPEEEGVTTIAVLHHPFVQSSKKHRPTARALWEYAYEGRTLPDILADGGVDLVLTGHTHTYERFLLERKDGRRMHVVNVSGRPRTSLLWIGDGARRARKVEQPGEEWFRKRGWTGLEDWSISQEDGMTENDRNQFAVVSLNQQGHMELEVVYIDEDDGMDPGPRTPLK